jgi:hypothetical protein
VLGQRTQLLVFFSVLERLRKPSNNIVSSNMEILVKLTGSQEDTLTIKARTSTGTDLQARNLIRPMLQANL